MITKLTKWNEWIPILCVLAAATLVAGCGRGGDGMASRDSHQHGASGSEDVAYYTCPMHPSVKASEQGSCPICMMDLTPVTREEVSSGVIYVDDERRQLIGVKTEAVDRMDVQKTIRAVARVAYDESKLSDVNLRFRGWVGELYVDAAGVRVEQGDPLFKVYSPELLSAQQEYLESYRMWQKDPERGGAMRDASMKRLLLWGLAEKQISDLERRGSVEDYVPMLAPSDGVVTEKHVVKGSAFSPGEPLLTIADLSHVWIEADLYDDEAWLIKTGQVAKVLMDHVKDEVFEGEVSFIYPFMEEASRTVRIRIELDNGEGRLRPGMYAHVEMGVHMGNRLMVPRDAILYAGKEHVLFVDLGEGKLAPRRVRTGVETKDLVEVLSGIDAGERIVTSGNFLIASESKLKSALEQW